jgi:hypothetical protein
MANVLALQLLYDDPMPQCGYSGISCDSIETGCISYMTQLPDS